MQPTPPGIYPDMPNAEYHGRDGISKSHLDDIAPERAKSPLHYWARRLDPERQPETQSEDHLVGEAFHCAGLEPDAFSQRYAVVPADAPRRPTSVQLNAKKPSPETLDAIAFWDGFAEESAGRSVLTQGQHDTVIRMQNALRRHPVAKSLITGGAAEPSYFAIDPETGALVKCRLDYDLVESRAMITDLKSARDASEDGFGRDATRFRYDLQPAWYPDVLTALYGRPVVDHFVFVVVEKEPPFAVGVYFAEPEVVEEARQLARRDLATILACRAAEARGDEFPWPDFGASPRPLRIKRWRHNDQLRKAA